MNFSSYLKQLVHPGDSGLSEEDAYRLYAAILDGGVPELELGGLLVALRMKKESITELLGFHRALDERSRKIAITLNGPRPIVIPSYSGARAQPNLLPLVAVLLARFGIPVLVHGTLESFGRITSAHILRELGTMPSPTLEHAQESLQREHLAFVPAPLLCPTLQPLLALRARLGIRVSPHTVVKLLNPLGAESILMVGSSQPECLPKFREFLTLSRANALLLQGTEDEAFANPAHRPALEHFHAGEMDVLFPAEPDNAHQPLQGPASNSAQDTAAWIRLIMEGRAPLPLPLVNQLAACLYAAGYTSDMNQAKAIAAVETGSLAGCH